MMQIDGYLGGLFLSKVELQGILSLPTVVWKPWELQMHVRVILGTHTKSNIRAPQTTFTNGSPTFRDESISTLLPRDSECVYYQCFLDVSYSLLFPAHHSGTHQHVIQK